MSLFFRDRPMTIDYVRVSTHDQNLEFQLDALRYAGCKKIYQVLVRALEDTRVDLMKVRQRVCKLLLRDDSKLVNPMAVSFSGGSASLPVNQSILSLTISRHSAM